MARLNIAMLSGEDNNQKVIQSQTELEVLGQQVEDDLLQAQHVKIQSDQEDAAVNDAVRATQDLLEEQQAAEELVERKGQVTQAAMESIHRNVKNILKTIGMEDKKYAIWRYAAEEDNSSEKPEEDAKVASSSIGDFIEKIWGAIMAVWGRIVEAIKGFFRNIFNASVRLKKRADAVGAAAKGMTGKSIPSGVVFEAPESVKNNIRLDYHVLTPNNIDSELDKHNKEIVKLISDVTSKEALNNYRAAIGMMAQKVANSFFNSNETKSEDSLDAAIAQTVIIESITKPITNSFPVKLEGEHRTEKFISDRALGFYDDDLAVEVIDYRNGSKLRGEHEALGLGNIQSVCEKVSQYMEKYEGLDKIAEDFNKFSKEIEKVQSDLINEKKDIPFIKRKLKAVAASKTVKFFINVIKAVSSQARIIDMEVNKAAIDWCAASLKLYK